MEMIDECRDKKTLGQLLNDTAARFGQREAWSFKGERITYRELRERVDRLAGGLLRLGIKKGDKVSLWMPNCLEWVYAYFAVAKVGAALVPVNTRFKTHEAEYVIGQSDSCTLILTDKFLNIDYMAMAAELCPELAQGKPGQLEAARLPKLRNVICQSATRYDGTYGFDEVMALGSDFPADELKRIEAGVDPDEVVIIVYTSGTTGFPKGAMHSHKIIRNMSDAAARLDMTEQDCIVLYLPLFHVYGAFATIINCTVAGARVALMDTYDVGESLRLMAQERATIAYGMDAMFYDQLRHPDFPHTDLSSLRTGVCPSGAPNLIPLIKDIIDRMCQVRGVYGMTETTSMTALTFQNDPPERVYSTSGYPLPGFQLKVIDPQTGQSLPANAIGEICAKGHPVMLGYYKKPEETAKAIDPDGWFHTGDLGLIDDKGYVRFMGRLKEIFRVGGENADPVEVEALLLQHPAISMVKVTGVPDKRLGEVGMAFVQFRPGAGATEQELIDFCKGKIANFKVPRYIMPVEEYPMTPSGKVKKFQLREMAVRELGLEE
jgi:fatty-acyl-CoA synthase